MLSTILTVIALYVLLMAVISELITFKVYGSLVSEEKLDGFFNQNLMHYREVHKMKHGKITMLFGYFRDEPKEGEVTGALNFFLPYIADLRGILTRYHIQDLGTIPRWSKWSRILDKHIDTLKALQFQKKVEEFIGEDTNTMFAASDPVTLHPEFVRGYLKEYKEENPEVEVSDAKIVSYDGDEYVQVKFLDGSIEEIPYKEYRNNIR